MEIDAKRAKGSNVKTVYDTLRSEILELKLEPGSLLDETKLAERFELSRSPVREALIRLGSEDLVTTLPNRSTIVKPIDIGAFPSYVDALSIAQRINTRLAAEHRTEEDLEKMAAAQAEFLAATKSGDHLAMSETNKAFHMAIAHAGKNEYLASFYERLLDEGRRILHLHFSYLETYHDEGYLLTDEHTEMLDAIKAKDIDRADKLALAHTRQFKDSFLAYMRKNYTEQFDF